MKANTTAFCLLAVVCTLVLASCPTGFAMTIRVANDGSGDYATIQAAIDGDINADGKVDWADFGIVASHWLGGYQESATQGTTSSQAPSMGKR